MISATCHELGVNFGELDSGTGFIPPEVLDAYGIDQLDDVRVLSGGRVNTSYASVVGNTTSVFQRLADKSFGESTVASHHVGWHLAQQGWSAPSFIPTRHGTLAITDAAGNTWRQQTFIDSDGRLPAQLTVDTVAAAGTMLGKWHKVVQHIPLVPQITATTLHDTEYHSQRLKNYRDQLPAKHLKILAKQVLDAYETLPIQDDATEQVVHGDPKLDNMLFRDSLPFTLIDFDTLMIGSPWWDVGDMMRSVLAHQFRSGNSPDPAELRLLTDAYRDAAGLAMSKEDTYLCAMQSTGKIALELSMRYLYDTVDNNYFQWNGGNEESRHNYLGNRARLQYRVAQIALGYTKNERNRE